jgi:formamidopyrimidine-DNA glycosylase
MPELPDLVHVEHKLQGALLGKRILGARTGDPTVLRLLLGEPFPDVLVGRTFAAVQRRGHFLCFTLDRELSLVVNCMLAGRFMLEPAGTDRASRALALALTIEGQQELRYVDDKRMGKVYVVPTPRLAEVPLLNTLGVEILSDAFTLAAFRKLAARRRDQVRQFLMDKRALASIGNAYADEILFAARLHPKTFVNKLAPADIDRLHHAIRAVMTNAIAEIRRRDEPVEVKVRDFLAVRGRAGQPCPVCGTTVREVRVGDGDACFCPKCQPATRSLFVDWGKLPPAAAAEAPAADATEPAARDKGAAQPAKRKPRR